MNDVSLLYIEREITKSDAAKGKETFRCILHYNKKKSSHKNIVQKFVQKNKKKTCIIKNHRIY